MPYKVSQDYLKNPSKDIFLSNSYKFSSSIIYKFSLKLNNSSSQNIYTIRNSTSIDKLLIGDFVGLKHDQLIFLRLNSSDMQKEESFMKILDFSKVIPANIKYSGRSIRTGPLALLHNADSTLLTGDFLSLGYNQLLYIDRNSKGDRMVIEDFSQQKSPAIIRYSEALGTNSVLKELFNLNNTLLAADFQGLRYPQILCMDHDSKGGMVGIIDFRKGNPHVTEIYELGNDLVPIAPLLDHGNLQFSGDFMGLGYSQVLFINRNYTKTENARIIIVDFSKNPPSFKYLEKWGESSLFGEWLAANDTQLVGDFMGLGYSQVLFVNHRHKGGKIMIADFSQGKPPASVRFREYWNNGIIFQGWLDINDTKVVGDFKGSDHSQILFLNNSSVKEENVTIVDFANSMLFHYKFKQFGKFCLNSIDLNQIGPVTLNLFLPNRYIPNISN